MDWLDTATLYALAWRGSGSQPTNDLGTYIPYMSCQPSLANGPLSRLCCLCSGTLSATFCPDLPHSPTFLRGLIGVRICRCYGNLQRVVTGSRDFWIWYCPTAQPTPDHRGAGSGVGFSPLCYSLRNVCESGGVVDRSRCSPYGPYSIHPGTCDGSHLSPQSACNSNWCLLQ